MKSTVNKKIINASPLEYNGIKFKSRLEKLVYRTLLDEGFPVMYEPIKYVVWEGFKPTIPFYNKDNATKLLKLDSKKMISITYTPDFVFTHNNHTVIIEAKGFENDCFPIKKKLFRAYLEKHCPDALYFEIYSKRQLIQAVDIIKSL